MGARVRVLRACPLPPLAATRARAARYIAFCNADLPVGRQRLNALFNLTEDQAEVNDLL
jgi:hypothetical protein